MMIGEKYWKIMKDDIILNKCETIKRCMARVREEYTSTKNFLIDYTRQDAALMNLERTAQASIDLASHIVRMKKIGVPQETKDLFIFLQKEKIISKKLSERMVKMVGFRNVSVHEYQKINMKIVVSIIKSRLIDFENFVDEVLAAK